MSRHSAPCGHETAEEILDDLWWGLDSAIQPGIMERAGRRWVGPVLGYRWTSAGSSR